MIKKLPYYQSLTDKLKHYQQRLTSFWCSLNLAQKCYLLAIVVSILYLHEGIPNNTFTVPITVLVLIAILSEFWPKFIKIWDSLPGKAIILLFYAFVANYALVQASGQVNGITGVSADNLPYTHNFAVLLSIPVWFFITSLVVLLIIQFAIPLYLLALLVLRPFGLHALWHPPGYRFPITTGLVRFGAGLYLLIQLASLATYTGALNDVSTTTTGIISDLDDGLNLKIETTPKEQVPSAVQNDPSLAQSMAELNEVGEKFKRRATSYENKVTQILENFIFNNEADSKSRCEHTAGSRVIELNDFEVLEIVKHDTADNTYYTYQVKPCISAAIGHQFRVNTTP
ncbi:hypothetical protein HG263_21310 [Pseudoalteromonas sp. JBTF-M23]|uniref:Uncharacterized protein n=1 Tax=Pseudoalteromonas caenipelagi TaxID=2726988 RepID=A0A849VMU9_9GAMM|nr:hypothetical protein [Pseudoalteromonas caenipelagi]NOU53044.1 hypothetical protein [Pseudoalteromonas caenipelagi]